MNIRKYIAEFIGTIMLVTIGCGTAVGSTALTGALGLEGSPLAVAAVVIGLALAAIVILGLPFTGTSVNPARSFGPALLAGGEALAQVWVFILAPLVGGTLAALVRRFVLTASEQ